MTFYYCYSSCWDFKLKKSFRISNWVENCDELAIVSPRTLSLTRSAISISIINKIIIIYSFYDSHFIAPQIVIRPHNVHKGGHSNRSNSVRSERIAHVSTSNYIIIISQIKNMCDIMAIKYIWNIKNNHWIWHVHIFHIFDGIHLKRSQ